MDQEFGAEITLGVVAGLIGIGGYVFTSIALAKIFVKLGEQPWKGWVPIVNTITLFELGRYSALWVIGLFIPALNLIALVVFVLAVHNVNRRLGHGGGLTALCLFGYPIWAGVLGFGRSVDTGWLPAVAATGYVPFAVPTPLMSAGAPGVVAAATRAAVSESVAPVRVPVPATPARDVPAPVSVPATPAPDVPAGPVPVPVPAPKPAVQTPPPVVQAPPAPPIAPPVLTVAPPVPTVAPPVPTVARPVPTVVSTPLASTTAPLVPTMESAPPVPRGLPTGPPPFYVSSAPPPAAVAPPSPAAPPVVAAPPAADDDLDDLDETMIVVRRIRPWTLETEHGVRISLTKPVVLLGRNPMRGSAHPNSQLVVLQDPDKTVSKTHARLDFVDGAWGIRDLNSTNGVVLIDNGGDENELASGASAALTERFLLGELAARIYLEA
ncbi:DUF5684 domain-containing protein [Cryobacterium sp. Y11]|uniref:DUF5684 domain-containing protein n=1 Tax=Cryobacterium sp. Y11 TaxID=2045016 RepID=UPI0011B0009F|nr:DUF5684 domain-containing protein [Cryobacterium sp. Y11]